MHTPHCREKREHRVADFDSIDDLIAYGRRRRAPPPSPRRRSSRTDLDERGSADYGVTKDELLRQTRAWYEEALRYDPYRVEEIVRAVFGADVFVWCNLTVRQITALRRGLLSAVLEGRGVNERVSETADSTPIGVLRMLQPGDMVTVESRELPRPRKLTVTSLSAHNGVYVTSGGVRPGHRSGGRIHVHDGAVFYDATLQQRPVQVSRLTRTAAAMAEAEEFDDGRAEEARRPHQSTSLRVKLLEGGWVVVPSLEAASAEITAEGDRLGVGVSDWKRDTGNVIDSRCQLVARISYNGRIWPPGSDVHPLPGRPAHRPLREARALPDRAGSRTGESR